MKISIHSIAIETFVPMLRSLSNLLDKGAEHARANKSDPNALVNARLAPDMYALAQQVQLSCDHAKDSTARLCGQEPPHFENNEKTLEDLKARIARTIDYVQKEPATAFDGETPPPVVVPSPNVQRVA